MTTTPTFAVTWRRCRGLRLACLFALTTVILGAMPVLAADLVASPTACRPAYPSSKSGCTRDDQCCSGLICQDRACRPGCRIGGFSYAPGASNPTNACQTCQPDVSTTSFSSVANGSSCNDANACTGSSTCQQGACVGSNPVVCPATDQCHNPGSCNPTTGACSNPSKANGSACNDGNSCTQTDSCQAGTCAGSNPIVCTAIDGCHNAGTCNPTTGQCSSPLKSDGASCSDGNACNSGDRCVSGVCTPTFTTVCVAPDQCHDGGTCNPATGLCSKPAKPNGSACSDGNACTVTDTCQSGACSGSNPVVCPAPDQCHTAGTCNTATGACSNAVKPDGTGCSDGTACTTGDTCRSGVCTPDSFVICPTSIDVCNGYGACNPATGVCPRVTAPDGSQCTDFNPCTNTDSCLGGTCTGSNPVVCAPQDTCHVAGTCDPGTGQCSNPPKPDGEACNDGNACTTLDLCSGGVCRSNISVICLDSPFPDPCRDAAACDPTNGQCGKPAKPDGTTCSDGNACTTADVCQGGYCVGNACGVGQTCCGPGCVNLGSDNANCGSCGNACQNSICFQGSCFDGCIINGAAYASGVHNGVGGCQVCDPAYSRTAWKNLGNFPNDQITCSEGCYSGFCYQGACTVTSPGGGCPNTQCAARSCNQIGICVSTATNEGGACTPSLSTNPCVSSVSGTCHSGECVSATANEGGWCPLRAPVTEGFNQDCFSDTEGVCRSGSCTAQALPAGTVCGGYHFVNGRWEHNCAYSTCTYDSGGTIPSCNNVPDSNACRVPQACGGSGTCNVTDGTCSNYPGAPWPSNTISCGAFDTGPHPERCCPGMVCICPPVPPGIPQFCWQFNCYNPGDVPY